MQHLRRALEFNLARCGAHGLPCGLSADWNDCLRLGFRGESVFVTFQLRLGLDTYAQIADLLAEKEEAAWARKRLATLDAAIQEHCWDGAWFVRAFREDGSVIGAQANDEGRIFLNAQSWAVLSGAATPEQAEAAMAAVEEHLATDYGIMVCTPPFVKVDYHVPWLTGAACWSYFAATHYSLGIRPTLDGLEVDPCLPSTWDRISITRHFRGKVFRIEIKNGPRGKGVKELVVNGQAIQGGLGLCGEENDVQVKTL